MAKSRKTTRITRSNRKAPAKPPARVGRPSRYRQAWAADASALKGFVPAYTEVSLAPPELVERAVKDKYVWIQRFVQEGCPRGKLPVYACDYAQAQGWPADRIPPYTTLREWVKRYQHFGLAGLVDRVRRDAGVSRTVVGPAKDYASLAMASGLGPATTLGLLGRIVQGELPKYDAVRRELDRIRRRDPHLYAMATMGPTFFRDTADLTLGFLPLAGGVRISIDSTVCDIWVRVPIGGGRWKALRPVLTVVEDVGSRLCVTFNLSVFSIDSGICLGTLGRAIDERRNYPGLHSIGVPHEIALDKGAEHQGAFREALERLRIRTVARRDNTPRGGAHIERLIGTITTSVFCNERGYTPCERLFDPYAPAEWDTKRNLKQLKYEPYRREIAEEHLLTLAELEARILGWAITYNARPHPALPENEPGIQAALRGQALLAQRPSLFASIAAASTATNDQEVA